MRSLIYLPSAVCGVSMLGPGHEPQSVSPRVTVDIARENMKVIGRVLVALIAAVAALFAGTGTSHAGLDNQLSLVDGGGRR